MDAISVEQLSFAFSNNNLTLENLTLTVPEGAIYGFLGPNGAGKTTTIRLILGLLQTNQGQIKLFGKSIKTARVELLSKIGSLIEQPSLYDHLSGVDNLRIIQKLRNVNPNKIDHVLTLVDMSAQSNKRVSAYSLGMKQRLGLAIALLSEPRLLILDEPANGLDPTGIIEIRELLLKLNRELGISIFLSSHLLSEIDKIVTHIGIINRGRMVFEGSIKELEEHKKSQSIIVIETNDNVASKELLNNMFLCKYITGRQIEVIYSNKDQVASICKTLVIAGIDIYKIEVVDRSLENVFLELIK